MDEFRNRLEARRRFLGYLASSPAFALMGLPAALGQSTRRYAGAGGGLIGKPEEALDVFDFEALARKKLPPAHWGYLATGTDDDMTIQANREGFSRFKLRPRRLVDVRKIDTSTGVLGRTWPSPIVIAPTGSNKAFHPEGELGVTRAARSKGHLQVLSSVASTSVEDVVAARGEPVWYQLYPRYSWDVTREVVDRAERAGCPAVVFTVDLLGGSNRLTAKRFAKLDERECATCHGEDGKRKEPMYDGLDIPGERATTSRG